MLVSVPLHLDTLPGRPTLSDLHDALAARYAGPGLVRVLPTAGSGTLEPTALNDTDAGWAAIGLDIGEVHITNENGDKYPLVVTKVDAFPGEDD